MGQRGMGNHSIGSIGFTVEKRLGILIGCSLKKRALFCNTTI
jgi:hypothetical protein